MVTKLSINTRRYISYMRLYRKALIHEDRINARRFKKEAAKISEMIDREKKKGFKSAS